MTTGCRHPGAPLLRLARYVVLATAVTLAGARAAVAVQKTFTASSGDWFNEANWTPRGVPAADDDVTVPVNRSVSVSAPATATAATLLLAGTIEGSGTLQVNETLAWVGGSMRGTGKTTAAGSLRIDNPDLVSLRDSRTLQNLGTATWTGVNFGNDPGTLFDNQGTFEIRTDADFSSGTFVNAGTVIKSAGDGNGTTRFTATFDNGGAVDVRSGVFELDGGGTHTGTFSVSAAARLQFGAAVHTVTAGIVSGSGTVEFADGFTELRAGTYGVTGETNVTGGVHVFAAAASVQSLGALVLDGGTLQVDSSTPPAPVSTYTQRGGTLQGSAELTVTGLLSWSGGTIRGSGVLDAEGGMLIAPATTIRLLDARMLINGGEAVWAGNRSLEGSPATVFRNRSGARLEIRSQETWGGGTFDNQGTVLRPPEAGDDRARFAARFNNSGTVTVQRGGIVLAGGGTHTGLFEVTGRSTLGFAGTHTLAGGAVRGGGRIEFLSGSTRVDAGSYAVDGTTAFLGGSHRFAPAAQVSTLGGFELGDATVDLGSGEALTVPSYTQSAGVLTGGDTLTVSGLLLWTGGEMRGTGVIIAAGGLQIDNESAVSLADRRTLENRATASWKGRGGFLNDPDALLRNGAGATLAVEAAAEFRGGRFENEGTLEKRGDAVSTTVLAPVNNAGTVRVDTGILRVDGGYTQTEGSTRVGPGALASAVPLQFDGGVLQGSGVLDAGVTNAAVLAPGLSPGRLDVRGDYVQTSGARYVVEIGGPSADTDFDQVVVAGAASLGGTLEVRLIDGFSPAEGDRFTVMTFDSRNGDFAAVEGVVLGDGYGFNRIPEPNALTLEYAREQCVDRIDNDGNGSTDCDDAKCKVVPVCIPTPTPTPTATPTATSTATVTPTATPTPPCTGDCIADGEVTVDEILVVTNVALGQLPVDVCPAADADGNEEVTVDEIVAAVNNALNGCSASARRGSRRSAMMRVSSSVYRQALRLE